MKIAAWVILIALSAVSTVVRSTSPEDELVFGQTFMADSMNATDGSNGWALVSHGIAQNLFTVSQEGEIVPQVAEKVSRVSPNEFKIHIKPNIKFSDGTPVTAADVAKALQTANEQNPNAQSSLGSIEAEPLDDNTVHVVSEDPTHIPESVFAEWAWPIFKVNDEGGYVFTGPYQVDEFADGEHIKLSPNEYYHGHEKRPHITIEKFGDGDELAKATADGDVDVAFHLPVTSLPAVSDADGIQGRSFPVGYTNMAVYNLCNASSPIQDIRVRQALDVAISREEMSESLAGGNPTRSFFPAETPFFYEPAEPAEPTEPAELLDAAGWTLDPETGKRTNSEGEDLELRVVAYPHRPGLPVLAGVIEETLSDLGISVDKVVTGDDWDETQTIIDGGDFDILLWAQHSLPAGDPLWFLNAFFGSGNAKNMGCYNSSIVDGMLEELSGIDDTAARVKAQANIQQQVFEDLPISNLLTPEWHVGLSDRVAGYEPYGSDFYVIRDDLHSNGEQYTTAVS